MPPADYFRYLSERYFQEAVDTQDSAHRLRLLAYAAACRQMASLREHCRDRWAVSAMNGPMTAPVSPAA